MARKDIAVDKRIQTVLELATRVRNILHDRLAVSTNLSSELEAFIHSSTPIPSTLSLAGKASQLDNLGSELWNAATRVSRDTGTQDEPRKKAEVVRFVNLLRIFAFFLLDSAHSASQTSHKDVEQQVRVFKVALKAARYCLTENDVDLALKVLERCSNYVSLVDEASPIIRLRKDPEGDSDDAQTLLGMLVTEYYLLRVLHASKVEHLDLAEHFMSKLSPAGLKRSVELCEKAASLFYDVSVALSKKRQGELATKWLERALQVLGECNDVSFGQHTEELRLAITSKLVRALSNAGSPEAQKKARALANELDTVHGLGHRMATLVMQLNLLCSVQPSDETMLSQVLMKMTRCALMEKTFTTIMQAIHRVRSINTTCADQALEYLTTHRLLPDIDIDAANNQYQEWLEKCIVTYTLFHTSEQDQKNSSSPTRLQSLLDAVWDRMQRPLPVRATHAAQTLLWKAAVTTELPSTEAWTALLRHPVFGSCGEINKARICRRAMLTALTRDDFPAAKATFFQMPQSAQDDPLSRYLAYKVALRSTDYDWGTEHLEVILRGSDDDQTLLYACALEAQKSTSRTMAVAAMQAIIEKMPQALHLPTLLRCAVRLLITDMDQLERRPDECVAEVLRLFEIAASNLKHFKRGTDDQWRREITWWSKNGYNLALRLCSEIHPRLLVRLSKVTVSFLDHDPVDGKPSLQEEHMHRRLICHFLCATALVVLGRSGSDESEDVLQAYLEARREINEFFNLWRIPAKTELDSHQSLARAFELHKLNLEAIFKLRQWQDIDSALSACLNFEGQGRWDRLADLVLLIHKQLTTFPPVEGGRQHTPVITQLLQKIINETWKRDKDIVQVARWVRTTFSIDLAAADKGVGSGEVALKLLGQAASLARRGADGKNERYPDDELQFLASVAFNRGVDFSVAGTADMAGHWFESALEIARYAGDNGSLHACLMGKRAQAEKRLRDLKV